MEHNVPPAVIHHSEHDYASALAYLLSIAQHSIQLFDPDLSRGDILSKAVSEHLQAFFNRSPHGQVLILMHSPQVFEQKGSRLQTLYQTYAHRMQLRVTDAQAHTAQDAILVVDKVHVLHRFHCQQSRFRYYLDRADYALPLSERLKELTDLAPTVLPTSVLGL